MFLSNMTFAMYDKSLPCLFTVGIDHAGEQYGPLAFCIL